MSEAFSGDCTASGVRGYTKQAIGEKMFTLTIKDYAIERQTTLTKVELDNFFAGEGYEILLSFVENNFVFSDNIEILPTFIEDYVCFLYSGLMSTLHFTGACAICLKTLSITNKLEQLQESYLLLEI